MLRPFTKIKITQIPTLKWPFRNRVFILDFVTEYEVSKGWETHTDTCFVKFPKNVRLEIKQDGIFQYSSTFGLILGGSGSANQVNTDPFGQNNPNAPLIMKGDLIEINHGYLYRNQNEQDCFVSTGGANSFDFLLNRENSLSTDKPLFSGYVSSVGSNTPIEIKCEDNFYLLKKTPFDKSVWNLKESGNNTSLYSMMQHILDLVNDKFNSKNSLYPKLTLLKIPNSITAQFSLGYLEIGDMTCAQLLDKLKQQYHFESTFKENELQFAFPIYSELSANSNHFFCFRDIFNAQNQLIASANIFPSHDLEYSNKDDIILTATVQCKVINKVPGKSTLSGKQKTKVEKLKVYIYWDIPTSTFKSRNISTGEKVPAEKDIGGEGERHQFYYPVDASNPNPTIAQLTELGIQQLKKYHYTGFRGCFSTFGFPYVEWNDNITILDPIYSDRNGQYKLRKVKYRGGLKGLSQEAHLDYKIDGTKIIVLPDGTVNEIKIPVINKNVKSISLL